MLSRHAHRIGPLTSRGRVDDDRRRQHRRCGLRQIIAFGPAEEALEPNEVRRLAQHPARRRRRIRVDRFDDGEFAPAARADLAERAEQGEAAVPVAAADQQVAIDDRGFAMAGRARAREKFARLGDSLRLQAGCRFLEQSLRVHAALLPGPAAASRRRA
jgi:hypothetical protein